MILHAITITITITITLTKSITITITIILLGREGQPCKGKSIKKAEKVQKSLQESKYW